MATHIAKQTTIPNTILVTEDIYLELQRTRKRSYTNVLCPSRVWYSTSTRHRVKALRS